VKPDIILVQSEKTEAFLSAVKYRTKFIQNGVDFEKFVPFNEKERRNMRRKYGFEDEDFIILHIGPIYA
jgi:glycosyltransferase involved in cell wall biosynthesis